MNNLIALPDRNRVPPFLRNALVAPDIANHLDEIFRRVRNYDYERTDDKAVIHLPKMHMDARGLGVFDAWHFNHVTGRTTHSVEENTVFLEGLDWLLQNALAGANWYIYPFSTNIAPVDTLTAATAPGALGEATAYAEGTRRLWVQDAEAGQAITNSGTKAVFTGSGGGFTAWGASMATANTKGATVGTGLCASQFGSSKPIAATDTLTLQYTFGLSN